MAIIHNKRIKPWNLLFMLCKSTFILPELFDDQGPALQDNVN